MSSDLLKKNEEAEKALKAKDEELAALKREKKALEAELRASNKSMKKVIKALEGDK